MGGGSTTGILGISFVGGVVGDSLVTGVSFVSGTGVLRVLGVSMVVGTGGWIWQKNSIGIVSK